MDFHIESFMTERVQALILAGGQAKRFGGECKCLKHIGLYDLIGEQERVSILEKWLLDLTSAGVVDITILAGKHYDTIKSYLRVAKKKLLTIDWDMIKVVEDKETLSETIFENLDPTAEKFIIINGDIVTDVSIKDMLRYENACLVVSAPSPYGHLRISHSDLVIAGKEGHVVGCDEKPLLHDINGGVYVFNHNILDFPEDLKKKDWETEVKNEIFSTYYVTPYRFNYFWKSVETPKDWEEVKRFYRLKLIKRWGWVWKYNPLDDLGMNLLFIKKGYSTSYHLHEKRSEAIYVLEGKLEVIHEDEKYILNKGQARVFKKGDKHMLKALEYSLVVEAYNGKFEDVVRYQKRI